MDSREQRGLVIAALCKLKKTTDGWIVPSQSSGTATYKVNIEKQTCTCPDHQDTGAKCKHVWASEITARRECCSDGAAIRPEDVVLKEKKTFKQNWPAYNRAQSTEKRRFQILLHDLCANLADRPAQVRGRKAHRVADCIFAMVFQVYCNLSSRRFTSDLVEAQEKGHVTRAIPGLKMPQIFEDEYFTPILTELIAHSAKPLRTLETTFAIDSSGFGSTRYEKWFDKKYSITRIRAKWIKAHVASGTRTNIVTAVRVLEENSADSPQFIPLVQETAKSFTIGEVSADKAYGSLANFEEVAKCGGQAYIAFKETTTGTVGGAFEKAFHYFGLHREEYMNHYHRRSNAESTFSAVKRKFGDGVRNKTDVAMTNEVLAKFLAHNLTVLIQEQETLGIAPIFWKDDTTGIDDYRALLPMVR